MLLAGLGAGAVSVAASAAPSLSLRPAVTAGGKPASWWDRTFLSLRSAGFSEWKAVVGEAFSLATPAGVHVLKVASVTAFPASGLRPRALGRSQAFAVDFEAVSGPPLPEGDRLYQLSHRTFPALPILMGAPSRVGRATRLTAVFN